MRFQSFSLGFWINPNAHVEYLEGEVLNLKAFPASVHLEVGAIDPSLPDC